jgi:hypothetical protein
MLAIASLGVASIDTRFSTRAAREAGRLARVLDSEHTAWASLQASFVSAGVASVRGEHDRCRQWLARARLAADQASAPLLSAAARVGLAQYASAQERYALTTEADALLSRERVSNPRRMMRTIVPWVDMES